MNKLLFSTTLCMAATVGVVTNALAHTEYVAPTGARGCIDCHTSPAGGAGYKPGVLEAFASGGIAGLKAFIQASADTKPVIHPINSKWDVTVGETPILIPLHVSDTENDTFAIHGSAPAGYSLSKQYIDSASNLPTVDYKWKPTAAQANKVYTVSFYAKETGTGRTLASNTVTAKIQVWPARVSATKNVSQFALQGAQWKSNKLTLAGQVIFKAGMTSAQRSATIANLRMSVMSAKGVIISSPLLLTPQANGNWSKTLPLTASQVPCNIKVVYEGLKSTRAVSLAPSTCVQ